MTHSSATAAKCRLRACLGVALIGLALPASAQDFMMQGWYWDYPKPGCDDYDGPSLATDMAARATAQASAGFTLM